MILGLIVLGLVAPWWVSVIWIIIVTAVSRLKISQGVITSGIVLGLVWLVAAMFFSRSDPNEILSKTGNLLGGLSSGQFMIVILVLGLVTGILAGWFGSALGQLVNVRTARQTHL